MKRFLLFLLLLVAASPGWSKPEIMGPQPTTGAAYITTLKFKISDATDSDPIGVNGTCSVRYVQVSGDDASLYAITNPTDAASSGTLIGAFTASTTEPTTFRAGTLYVKAKATDSTAGGSTMTIHCSNAEVAGGGIEATQPSPSVATNSEAFWASITDPATANFGFNTHFGDPDEFSPGSDAETYPGSGVEILEADNQMGVSYNKYLNDNPINIYEHAFDESWELSYRDDVTEDGAWVEQNYDVYPPKLTATLSSIGGGFNPAVGSYVTFSGGGTGRVYSWSNPTLVWIQFSGITAAGETVAEAATPTDTATLGTPAASALSYRPYLSVWRTYSNRGSFQWDSNYGGPTTLKVQNEGVSINSDDQVVSTLEVHGANSSGRDITGTLSTDTTAGGAAVDGYPVMWVQYEGEYHPTSGNTAANAQWIRMDYDSLANSVSVVDYGKGLVIKTPIEPGAANDVYQSFGMVIESQRGVGNNHGAAISMESQTCAAGAACSDGLKNNFEFVGGTYNTGHLSFSGQGESTDHIFRDDTNEVFRVSTDDAPDSETDGRPIVTGSNSAVYGPTMWAISNGGSLDSGDEICQASGVGMTCQDVLEFSTPATPTDSTCATAHANAVKFLAMCK